MRFAILLALLASGCVLEPDPWVMPEAHVRAESSSDIDYWRGQVEVAARYWNDALVGIGCAPAFVVSDAADAKAIKMLAPESWDADPSYWGVTNSERIEIKDVRPTSNLPTLVHELGHAIGLGHSDPHASSVMTSVVGRLIQPTAQDLEAARQLVGC